MKNKIIVLFLFVLSVTACSDFPVDEDGLLITTRTECYVSNFDLIDTDLQSVKVGNAYVKFGTPLINLWPQISLCEDAKLDPKIVERMDFSVSKMNIEFMEGDWKSGNATTQLNERIVDNPSAFPSTAKRFTVIAGNREIKKEYIFLIVERPLQ